MSGDSSSSTKPGFGHQLRSWVKSLGWGSGGTRQKLETIRYEDLGPGDIVLIQSRMKSTALAKGVSLPPQVVRNITSAQTRGTVSVQQQNLNSFTHAALILKRKGRSYAALPTREGIELFPAAKWLRKLTDSGVKVIVRQLKVQFTVDMREILEDLLKAAAIGCSWAQQIPGSDSVRSDQDRSSVATRSSGHKSSTAASVSDHAALTNSSFMSGQSRANGWVDDSASARSSRSDGSNTLVSERTDLTPFGKRLLKMLLPRIWAAVSKVPSKIQMEVRRAFRILDDDNDGWIHVDQLEEVLKQVNGSHPFKYESEQIVKLLPDPEAFVICEKDILHSLMRNPLSHIPLEHDLDSIVCGEFVATVYELMGLLPERTIEDLKHSASEATCTENKHSNGSAIKSSPVLEKKPDKASVRVAPAPEYRATEIEEKIASGGSNRRKNHHEDDELNDSDPDTDSGDDLYSHSPSRHKAKRKTQKEISDYINVLKQKETDHKKEEKDFREKDKQVKEKKKTVDYATRTRHHGLAGTKKQKQPKSYAFSIVVVDDTSQSTDFLHFVPMSFCTKHDPPLKLQMGRLTPEAYIDVPTEDQEEEDAEAVRNNSKKSKGKVAPT